VNRDKFIEWLEDNMEKIGDQTFLVAFIDFIMDELNLSYDKFRNKIVLVMKALNDDEEDQHHLFN
jgi:hypothetical protein